MAKVSIGVLFNNVRACISPALEFIQRPIPLTIIAILAGFIGLWVFPPLLLLCWIALVCDYHVFRRSHQKPYSHVPYAVFALAAAAGLMIVNYGVSAIKTKIENDAAQQRIQTMFAADRERPLTDIYAILRLNRLYSPSELTNFSVTILISQAPEITQEKIISLSVQDAHKQPFLWPYVVPGINVKATLYPPGTSLGDIFIWHYVDGLNRIELGGYRSVPGAPKTLGELDKAFIQVLGTKPLSESIAEILIVANDYVIWDVNTNDLRWRSANTTDLEGLKLERDTGSYQAAQSQKQFLDFSDLVAKRGPLKIPEIPVHPDAGEQIRVVPGQHGWLLSDKEND
jgi:hypothetical protein